MRFILHRSGGRSAAGVLRPGDERIERGASLHWIDMRWPGDDLLARLALGGARALRPLRAAPRTHGLARTAGHNKYHV